jgi:hypothetical protein
LYKCKTWSLSLREGAEENIWTQETKNNKEIGENCMVRSAIICMPHHIPEN